MFDRTGNREIFGITFLEMRGQTGRGKIELGNFAEGFECPLGFWTIADYEWQWTDGLRRIIDGESKSALVIAMHPPHSANFIMWWLLYRDDSRVHFRNHLLLLYELKEPFDVNRIYSSIPDRSPGVDDEFPVSEWSLE